VKVNHSGIDGGMSQNLLKLFDVHTVLNGVGCKTMPQGVQGCVGR